MEKYDVGIVGLWSGCNYGSIATYYALNQVVSSMGKTVLMIDKPILTENDVELKETHSRIFGKKHYQISKQYRLSELSELNEICDTFMIGSDQVWNYGISKNFGNYFYFDFVDADKKKIAYAVSFGHGVDFAPPEKRTTIAKFMSRFDGISTREADGVRLCRDAYGIAAEQVLDPVFLADPEIYTPLINASKYHEEEPFLATYILDPTPEKREAILHLSKELGGIKIINMLDGLPWTFEKNKKLMDLPNCVPRLTVEDWLYYISHARFLLTDSCHGASFALIFKKDFIAITNRHRGVSRFKSLSELFHVEDRVVSDPSVILTNPAFLNPVNYDAIGEIMQSERKRCRAWLEDKLNQPKKTLEELRQNNYIVPPSAQDTSDDTDIIKPNSVMTVVRKKMCTGCSACEAVCPKKAITMKENSEGFLYPSVAADSCVNCGICTKKCVMEHPVYKNEPKPKCFAMMADDATRKISSSGGMFTVAADYILEKGGYVCGAAYRDDFTVEHIIIHDKADLKKLRGSKYMQSHLGNVYREIQKLLSEDKLVLFTGMPCQVAGLYAFLGKEYSNLYTIDLLCHGITSSKVFQKYHHDVLGGKPLHRLEFKEKQPWGWHAGINAYFEDGTKYEKPLETDRYFIAYLKSIAKNTTCEACKANRLPRQGDLTMGDFWGIARYDTEMHDGAGTSVVLANNAKGEQLFHALQPSMKRWKEEPLDVAIKGNRIIQAPYRLHKNRKAFFEHFDVLDFAALTMGCFRNRLYEAQKIQLLKTVPEQDHELYYLAKLVSEQYRGRQIVTWLRSPRFEGILKKYFNLTVAFSVTQDPKKVDGKQLLPIEQIKGASSKYYLVAAAPNYSTEFYKLLSGYGYTETTDFVFRNHKPIVLEKFDLSKGRYEDQYGNTVEGYSGVVGKIVFRGGNNHIVLGDNIRHTENLTFDLSVNAYVEIGNECTINAPSRFIVVGLNGNSKIVIREKCRLTDALVRVYNHVKTSSILINESCTFETDLELHANSGKKIIIGRDCMFSHGIDLWAGDGHSVFDVTTGKNVNSDYDNLPAHKNMIVIGEHVWVSKGAFIMHGTNIGSGSIVGAMSVVKGIYPNNCTIAGNPAAMVKKDVAWSRDMLAENPKQCGGEDYYSSYFAPTSSAKAPISGLNVLVIGGTRFMGIQLVKRLIALGNHVTIATRGRKPDDFGIDVNRLVLDVSDRALCKKALTGKKFDVVFDNLAYCSEYANNILSFVQCKRYCQLSSVEAYKTLSFDMKEELFDPLSIPLKIVPTTVGYVAGKRQAEAVVYQKHKDLSAVTVRIPYVAPTNRLLYYCENIVHEKPMHITDLDHAFTFIRDTEVGEFLTWIAAQDYNGPINLASTGFVSVRSIIEYIEKKTNKKAIIVDDASLPDEPFKVFKENAYSMNMDKATGIGYRASALQDWFWKLLDYYISAAIKKK